MSRDHVFGRTNLKGVGSWAGAGATPFFSSPTGSFSELQNQGPWNWEGHGWKAYAPNWYPATHPGSSCTQQHFTGLQFLHNPLDSNRPCSVYCIWPAGNFCSTQNPTLSRTVSSGFGIYTIRDMCGEVLIITHQIALNEQDTRKQTDGVLILPWTLSDLGNVSESLSFSFHTWEMEAPKNTGSKDTLPITLFPLL